MVTPECVFSLLNGGADVAQRDEQSLTPLHAAVMGGHLESSRLLIGRGADPHASDAKERTPVVLAIALGIPEIYFLGRAASDVS